MSNTKAVQYWKEEGLDRVVLARETGAMEMKEMKENVDIEIEAFIHGAMCIAYSGRCTPSNHMTLEILTEVVVVKVVVGITIY